MAHIFLHADVKPKRSTTTPKNHKAMALESPITIGQFVYISFYSAFKCTNQNCVVYQLKILLSEFSFIKIQFGRHIFLDARGVSILDGNQSLKHGISFYWQQQVLSKANAMVTDQHNVTICQCCNFILFFWEIKIANKCSMLM